MLRLLARPEYPLSHRLGITVNAPDRDQILAMCRDYFDALPPKQFTPGKTYLPASGKVLDGGDLAHLVDACLDLWLTGGRFSQELEKALAAFTNTKKASLTVSGSAANLLAVAALTSPKLGDKRLKPGDEVLTVAAGFPTTVTPIVQNGCLPVFVEVDLATANVDTKALAGAVTQKTRAVILAHTLGNPFDLAAVKELCEGHGLWLIEDCCDALGALYAGEPTGSFGHLATLSFYPAHHITTGEGGAVLSANTELARLVESFRDWGRDCWCATGHDDSCKKRFSWQLGELPFGFDHKFIFSHLGYNLKMTDMQAALGLSQLAKAERFIAARRENFNYLKAALTGLGLEEHFILPQATKDSVPSWFGFLLTIRDSSPLDRTKCVSWLEEHKVGTRLLFGGNLTRQPAFSGVDYRISGGLANTDKLMRDAFWVGVWPGLEKAALDYMAETLARMVREMAS